MTVMKNHIYCKRIKAYIAVFSLSILCSSCGTLFCTKGEVPALTITSSVPNAEVYLNGRYVQRQQLQEQPLVDVILREQN